MIGFVIVKASCSPFSINEYGYPYFVQKGGKHELSFRGIEI
jgi:hypothetical protein